MTPQERAQRWRQEIESDGGRVETLLEVVAQLLSDVSRLGAEVSGRWLPERGHKMLSLAEAARHLAISERTLYRWVQEKRIRPQIDDPLRFRIEALDQVRPRKRTKK